MQLKKKMNYFDFIKEFFSSEFATNNIILLIALIVLCIVLGGVIVWLYHKFIKNNRLQNLLSKKEGELEKTQDDLTEAQKQIKNLEDDNSELKQKLEKYEIQEALNLEYDENTMSPAIKKFIK